MNPNIEIISPHLMGVRFSHVQLCWIKDFEFLDDKMIIDNPYMTLTASGILLLNKDEEAAYKILKNMLIDKIMPSSDEELKIMYNDFMPRRGSDDFDFHEETFLNMIITELMRRELAAGTRKKVGKKWRLWNKI